MRGLGFGLYVTLLRSYSDGAGGPYLVAGIDLGLAILKAQSFTPVLSLQPQGAEFFKPAGSWFCGSMAEPARKAWQSAHLNQEQLSLEH